MFSGNPVNTSIHWLGILQNNHSCNTQQDFSEHLLPKYSLITNCEFLLLNIEQILILSMSYLQMLALSRMRKITQIVVFRKAVNYINTTCEIHILSIKNHLSATFFPSRR